MSDAPDFDIDATKRQGDGAIPRFYTEATQNMARSEADGTPRFDEVEMVEILIPGDRKSISVQVVREEHRRRWPQAYARFKASQGEALDGTPIEQLPGITRSQAEELKYQHVSTIEIMADLPDDKAMTITMGGMALRDRAKRYLDATAGAAQEERLAAENRAKDEKIAFMEGQMADLQKRLEALSAQVAGAQPAPPVPQPE